MTQRISMMNVTTGKDAKCKRPLMITVTGLATEPQACAYSIVSIHYAIRSKKKRRIFFCSNSPAHSLILNIFLATLVTFPTVHTLFFRSLLCCCCCNCILEYMWCEMLCRLCHLTALSLQFSCCCYIRAQLCKWVHWSANQIHRLILINV